jgi:curved DNA-binding protein CbpA
MKLASTYYQILGVSPNATTREIKLRYRQLVRLFHPDVARGDKRMAEQVFVQINIAYHALRNEEKRRSYDESLSLELGAAERTAAKKAGSTERPANRDKCDRMTVPEALSEAEAAFLRGNFGVAEELCRRILAAAPNTAGAHRLLADTLTHAGLPKQALRHYSAAVEAGDSSRLLRDKIKRMQLIYGEV